MRALALPLALCMLAICMTACGSAPARRVIIPMTPEDEIAFENGIDFIDDPGLLEGTWLEEWQRDVQQRTELADAVLLVRVRAVNQNVDLDRRQSYRLALHVETIRYGTGIEDDVAIVSREHEPGYASVHENEARLLNQQFVAFLRFTETATGEIVPRWHLSPASEPVMRRVSRLLDERPRTRRVTVRDSRDPSTHDDAEEE